MKPPPGSFPILPLFAVFALVTGLVGCRQDNQVVVPNRVLDRPLDVALSCVRRLDDGTVQTLSLDGCSGAALPPRCDTDRANQLIGFVANSERNEVAMFRRCDASAGLVDLDPEAPGYNFVPVGQLPSRIVTTNLGCQVVTANVGSCDLSVIDGRELGAYAVELTPRSAPSTLVSTVLPRLADGEPLGSRPGDLLAVPRDISLAAQSDADPAETDGGFEDPTDGGEGEFGNSTCPVGQDASVYVTFPACQLVAEVSLTTQRILQSRQFVRQDDGSVIVVDTGTDPACPVECPAQFQNQPDARAPVDPGGFFPMTLALVRPVPDDAEPDEAEQRVTYPALYVGGTGSDTIIEIQFETAPDGRDTGTWVAADASLSLTLENPSGVHRIVPTPAADVMGSAHQFLYVVAGDGSTHVVDRDFDSGSIGVECDTQVDPTLVDASPCHPIDPNAFGNAPERRPFALGPGIRAPIGGAINDWTFHKVRPEDDFCGGDAMTETDRSPYCAPGLVGVGVTSFGRVILGVFGQYQDAQIDPNVDPVGVMQVQVPPHALWPSLDPTVDDPEPEGLPRMDDNEPTRSLPGPDDQTQVLSPSLRRIDLAYAVLTGDVQLSPERELLAQRLGAVENVDQLGQFDGSGLYEEAVTRVAVRDYQEWSERSWALAWEGPVAGTRSSTGRIECDTPGWESGTCNRLAAPQTPGDDDRSDDSRLVDEGASFCDSGVLPGDKVVLLGCETDDSCGLGQRCLREPTAPASATGICVSAQAYEDEFETLRTACAPFINDPCGAPRREYVITRALQNELHLEARDIPPTAHARAVLDEDDTVVGITELEDRYTCRLPAAPMQATENGQIVGCTGDEQCRKLGGGGDFVCDADGACRGPCSGGIPECYECLEDADCLESYGEGSICSDNRCRRPCEPGRPDCTLAPLPGPRCFAEFVRYEVRVRDSFVVQGQPQPGFIADRVFADPVTAECREDLTASNLLTSRLWLGADENETWNHPTRGIADCPDSEQADPTDPNPCRIVRPRASAASSLFHTFAYQGEDVAAVRFSNPFMSFILDLSSLEGLGTTPEGFGGVAWPPTFSAFRRARIPRGYSETMVTLDGYVPFNEPAIVANTPMVYPVRIIQAPTPGHAFIVDAGGRGGVAGVRGQIIRINASAVDQQRLGDDDFRVR